MASGVQCVRGLFLFIHPGTRTPRSISVVEKGGAAHIGRPTSILSLTLLPKIHISGWPKYLTADAHVRLRRASKIGIMVEITLSKGAIVAWSVLAVVVVVEVYAFGWVAGRDSARRLEREKGVER